MLFILLGTGTLWLLFAITVASKGSAVFATPLAIGNPWKEPLPASMFVLETLLGFLFSQVL
jgi:hypothetical protein